MKSLVLLFLTLLIFESEKVLFAQEKIEVNPNSRCKDGVNLSDLILDINYIPLETKSESLISDPAKIRTTDNLIFVKNRNPQSLKVFDYNGNYVTDIGKKGNGPGEFTHFISFGIDEIKKIIVVFNAVPYKLLTFGYDGKFKESFPYNDGKYVNDIDFISDNKYIVMKSNASGSTDFSYHLYTNNHQLIAKRIKPINFTMKGSFGLSQAFSYYIFKNQFIVKENLLNDTVYFVSAMNSMIPKYVFDFGKLAFPLELQKNSLELTLKARESGRANVSELDEYIMPDGIFETNSYIILCYRFNQKFYWGYYNKQTKETCTTVNQGIINDYDGGPLFHPIYQKNNMIIGFIHAYEFIDYINSSTFKNSTPKYPEKKKELEKLANSLNENDNPVLMLVKLKE